MTTDAPLAIGIDLGTTNSALAWVGSRGKVEIFEVPQLIARGEIGRVAVLPSFIYLPDESERSSGAYALPWAETATDTAVVGLFAREHGALVPSRQIASSKSWLVNASVDRMAPILPWGAEGVPRLSPIDASARILEHLRRAWDHERASSNEPMRLDRQSVVLTVPASFEEEARELTVDAARRAGLASVRLLEEPLAALYAWIATHRRLASDQLADGDLILVCDVGGGTTDFTMIRTTIEGGEPRFERIAIGEHLLLGGDNVDLALAVLCEQKLAEHGAPRLTLGQRHTLRRKASDAKERLLSDDDAEGRVRVTLLGAGRGVVAGGMTTELTREEVVRTLADGFLPLTAPDDLPARDRRVALRELGLPFESDPAITRHLAGFLTRAAQANGQPGMLQPDVVLFNGGFFTPMLPRTRVLDGLEAWFGRRPRVLENARPEAAVAAGAAFYARLLQNPEAASRLLIRAGSARAYFIGVAVSEGASHAGAGRQLAVCVMPRGTQEGITLSVDREFSVMTNRPLAFTLYSTTQREGSLNEIVAFNDDDDLRRHAPLVTALRYGKRSRSVPLRVQLRVAFTETGTLELWCESKETDHRWRLAFNLRGIEADPLGIEGEEGSGEVTGDQVVIEPASLDRATALITQVFTGAEGAPPPDALVGELENVLGYGKQSWPLAAIRTLADALVKVEVGRRLGREFEIRWLNLTGFCGRPGFGTALDTWRISELRKVYSAGLAFPKDVQAQVEWLVLWQRISAGFSTGQQRELAQRVMGQLGVGQKKAPRVNAQIEREGWRLLANLERVDAGLRTKLGDEVIDRVRREPKNPTWLWSIGRFGTRQPLYGPLNSVVPPSVAERWIDRLLTLRVWIPDTADAVIRIAALTGDAARDVDPRTRGAAIDRLREAGCDEESIAALVTIRPPDRREASRAFGESLPEGLRLENAHPSSVDARH